MGERTPYTPVYLLRKEDLPVDVCLFDQSRLWSALDLIIFLNSAVDGLVADLFGPPVAGGGWIRACASKTELPVVIFFIFNASYYCLCIAYSVQAYRTHFLANRTSG